MAFLPCLGLQSKGNNEGGIVFLVQASHPIPITAIAQIKCHERDAAPGSCVFDCSSQFLIPIICVS